MILKMENLETFLKFCHFSLVCLFKVLIRNECGILRILRILSTVNMKVVGTYSIIKISSLLFWCYLLCCCVYSPLKDTLSTSSRWEIWSDVNVPSVRNLRTFEKVPKKREFEHNSLLQACFQTGIRGAAGRWIK